MVFYYHTGSSVQFSRAANHYVLVVVYYVRGHCSTLLCLWSYHYALSPKNKRVFFFGSRACMWASNVPATGCMCAFFHVCGVGCAPGNQRSRFKPADQLCHSVQFPLLCIAAWWDSFCFQSFQIAVLKRKAESSWVINLIQKMHTKLSRKNRYRKVSVHCMINAERWTC